MNDLSFDLAKILSKSETFGKDIPELCRRYHPSGNPRKITDPVVAEKMYNELTAMFDKLPEDEKPTVKKVEKEETDE